MIGLIFGETEFPKYILKRLRKNHKYLIIDLTKKNIQKREKFIPCFNWSIWKNFINTKI